MKISQERKDFISKLALLKNEAMQLGLYRTGQLLEIPIIEVGWDVQGVTTPPEQKKRQIETLRP